MDKKKKKLTEEALNEVGTAQPVPATPQEVAAATPAETAAPATEEPVDVVATPQVPADDSPAIDPLAPPAEGMVPTGWAYPEDLAAAVAMATGDVEAAGTAADATVTDQPLVSEEPVEGTEPVSVAPKTTDELSMEEKQLVMEFRKKKLQEADETMLEAPLETLPSDDMMVDASSDEDIVSAGEEETTEPSIDMSAILASVDAVFGDEEEDCEECEETALGEDEECEECKEEEEEAEEGSVEQVSNTLTKLSQVLDQLNATDSDDAEGMTDETTDITKSEVDKAFDFLSALEDNIFNDEEGTDEDEDFEEEEDDESVDEVEDPIEDSAEEFTFSSAIKEAIKYPAGSAPKASAIASSSDKSVSEEAPAEDENEEDLVRSYEKKSRARREAFVNFRDSLIQKRKEGSRFNEALNSGSEASEEASKNSKAWVNNTFIAKYNESKKLNWKDLFDKGLLG